MTANNFDAGQFGDDLPATPSEPPPPAGLVHNETIDVQLGHRTIRSFQDREVPADQVATLLDVARHAATSTFYQQRTIIQIKDPAIREEVYKSSKQPYVGGSAGELFIFVVDLARNAYIRQQNGASLAPLESTALFMQAMEDTMLAAQNMAVAAESLGLGVCYLGSVRREAPRLIRALNLPKYTFPSVGMLVGYPAQSPQMKPRLPRELTSVVDQYPDFSSPEAQELLANYDETIQTYYDLREGGKRQDSFTDQIVNKPGTSGTETVDLLQMLHDQGLCLR